MLLAIIHFAIMLYICMLYHVNNLVSLYHCKQFVNYDFKQPPKFENVHICQINTNRHETLKVLTSLSWMICLSFSVKTMSSLLIGFSLGLPSCCVRSEWALLTFTLLPTPPSILGATWTRFLTLGLPKTLAAVVYVLLRIRSLCLYNWNKQILKVVESTFFFHNVSCWN